MNKRKDIMDEFYSNHNEDVRLIKSYHGQLEYFTTMTYIHKFLKPNMKVLEIGAGTGRYLVTLAKECLEVTAIEYVEKNVEVLKQNSRELNNLFAFQGDAVNLEKFCDNTFDMVLSLGPLYHLYSREEQGRAIDEAIRVAKEDGIIMFAYIPVSSFIFGSYMNGNLKYGLSQNFDENFNVLHFPEQKFTGFDINEFELMLKNKNIEKLNSLTTDGILSIVENTKDFKMSNEDFELFKTYHLHICEKPEMQGMANHMLYICKKIK